MRILGAIALSVVLAAVLLVLPGLSRLLPGTAAPPTPTAESSVKHGTSLPKPKGHRYVVKAGDTLRSIAARFYGDERRWRYLYRVNAATIRHPDALKVGTRLKIP